MKRMGEKCGKGKDRGRDRMVGKGKEEKERQARMVYRERRFLPLLRKSHSPHPPTPTPPFIALRPGHFHQPPSGFGLLHHLRPPLRRGHLPRCG